MFARKQDLAPNVIELYHYSNHHEYTHLGFNQQLTAKSAIDFLTQLSFKFDLQGAVMRLNKDKPDVASVILLYNVIEPEDPMNVNNNAACEFLRGYHVSESKEKATFPYWEKAVMAFDVRLMDKMSADLLAIAAKEVRNHSLS